VNSNNIGRLAQSRTAILVAAAWLLLVSSTSAHHSYAMFDGSKTLTVSGTVAKLEWANPHVFIWMYVPNPKAPKGGRIYTDGRPLPAAHEDTNTGTSVGHWEGQTLVVQTVGVSPTARFPGESQGAMPIGKHVKITERIWLQDPNTLQFEVVTTAPDLFVRPDKRQRTYTRVPDKTTASEITFCVDHDRSIDPATGKQRFDMTPPPDLAPPPAH